MSADTFDVDTIRAALTEVRRAVESVERPVRRPVEIMAVTKGFAPDLVRVAVAAGCDSIGENYAQELLTRREVLDSLGASRPKVSFIGHLQSNKVRQLVGIVDVWATVDRPSLATEIARRDPGGRIMVQVNATAEAQKSGCAPEDVGGLVEHARRHGLEVEGLLAMGPTTGDPRPAFDLTRRLVDEHGLDVCSIGMSGDLAQAVAAGSTQIRVGTALFGPRPPR